MNYELAKQLKDAGFPMRNEYGDLVSKEEVGICFPSLSELIEACGDKFASLEKRPDWKENDSEEIGFWHCWGRLENNKLHVAKTPEEAVAKLYLEIRKLST